MNVSDIALAVIIVLFALWFADASVDWAMSAKRRWRRKKKR